jgi:hypothetical protein
MALNQADYLLNRVIWKWAVQRSERNGEQTLRRIVGYGKGMSAAV